MRPTRVFVVPDTRLVISGAVMAIRGLSYFASPIFLCIFAPSFERIGGSETPAEAIERRTGKIECELVLWGC